MSIQSLNSAATSHLIARPPGAEVAGRSIDTANTASAKEEGAKSTSSVQSSSDKASPLEQRLEDVVKEVNEFIKPINNSLQFSIDDGTGTTVVKVIDAETDEVIKQIPSEEMLALAKAIGQLKGLLVKQQA